MNHRHTRPAAWFLALTAAAIFTFSGCFRPTSPIPTIQYGRMDATENKNLLILLRGLGGSPEDFDKHGLIREIRSRGLPFDIVVPDAHFGYYRSKTLEERLKADIIDPARRKGYRRIWLAGFSMGGLGSLFYLKNFKKDIDGVILCSPFMGWEAFLNQIDASGGIDHWQPDADSDNWQHLIWSWVKDYTREPNDYPPIFLGYGTGDTMTGIGPALLSAALPKENAFAVSGGHTYKTFKKIWETHLDRLQYRFQRLSR